MKTYELYMPIIGKETPIGREFREMMEDLGIRIYSNNGF